MKNGTAISGKELMPLTMLASTIIGGMPLVATKASDARPSATATGTPMIIKANRSAIIKRIDIQECPGLQSVVRCRSSSAAISSGFARIFRQSERAE